MDFFSTKPIKQSFYAKKEKQKEQRGGKESLGIGYHPTCLESLVFVFTGEMEHFGREEAQELVKSMSGKTTIGPSKKTSYMVCGSDPGPSKVQKAKDLGTPILTEEEFIELLKDKIANPPTELKRKASVSPKTKTKKVKIEQENEDVMIIDEKPVASDIIFIEEKKTPVKKPKSKVAVRIVSSKVNKPTSKPTSKPKSITAGIGNPTSSTGTTNAKENPIFVEKYRPQTSKDIVGNTKVMERLIHFLTTFDANSKVKGYKKAVMLAGPPGIGKTSMALVAAREAGLDVLEFNASDTRSKTSMQKYLKESFQSNTISSFYGSAPKRKVIIMDEVDGLGAGDRGGNMQLIQFIKTTKVPVICICNDKQNQKVKSLLNYCEDMMYRKPTFNQIQARILKICAKEHIKVTPSVIENLVKQTNADIRQILNILNTFASDPSQSIDYFNCVNEKDVSIGIFEIANKSFTKEFKRKSFSEQFELFFSDYELAPLMVHENYLKTSMSIEDMAEAADSMSFGDVLTTTMRSKNQWSLLNSVAVSAFIVPLNKINSTVNDRLNFPSTLGKISTTNKSYRLLKEMSWHSQLTTHCTSTTFRLQYISSINRRLLHYFKNEDMDSILKLLTSLSLVKEDMDSCFHLGCGELGTDALKQQNSKFKSALTRTFNSLGLLLPFDTNVKAVKKTGKDVVVADIGEAEVDVEVEEESNEVDDEEKQIDKLKSKRKTKKKATKTTKPIKKKK